MAVTQRHSVAQQREIAVAKIHRPVDDDAAGGFGDHAADRIAAGGGELFAWQPDEGEQVSAQHLVDE